MPRVLTRLSTKEAIFAGWGLLCVSLLLMQAIWRLTPIAIDALPMLSTIQWLLLSIWVVFNLYVEGYRAFQQRFCPRVIARAIYLAKYWSPLRLLLALPFCMSLIFVSKKRLIARVIFLTILIAVIISVKLLPQPWRGLIDAGVVAALGYGVVALWVYFIVGLRQGFSQWPDDLPDGAPQSRLISERPPGTSVESA